MTTSPTASAHATARRARTGRWILIVTAALLVVNGAWLVGNLASPATIEQDTGASVAAVEDAFPGLIDTYARQGANLGILVTGLGLVALTLSWFGLASDERSAWAGVVAVFVTVAALAVRVITGGRLDVGLVWLLYAALLLVGLVLTARRRSVA